MATAANKNKIRTFETEIGPQNKNIEAEIGPSVKIRTLRLGKILLVLNKKSVTILSFCLALFASSLEQCLV